ncbi:cupin domain-containing protein [Emticicia sp. BO119]|uniref:cupin domain-containing protein n=1 Tax=Emticicia sp. BO119 TaxID=2757768 RepID=UPI0015F0775D|nr:cupin domain-containing protein [Emticicia sp. BO119]MBA4850374.1 cupin domain-containing protein [Emticicia sp. BO119]
MKRKFINPEMHNEATFIQFACESEEKITIIENVLQAGGGNRLHYHKTYTEIFTAIEGELGLMVGRKKEIHILQPGESFSLLPGTPHCFFNPGEKAIKFRSETTPGHEGFEKSIMIGFGLAADGHYKKNFIRNTSIILSISEMSLPGIFSLFEPVWKCIAYFSKNYTKTLEKKYCTKMMMQIN